MEKKKYRKVDIFSENVFHTNIHNMKLVPWKDLSVEERIEKMKEYFAKLKDVPEKEQLKIIDLLQKKKLRWKKEIHYDELNKRIINVRALIKDPETKKYIFSPQNLSQKQKSIKAANNLLKK